MEKKLESYNVKPVVFCCGMTILGINAENKTVGVTVYKDSTKNKYYVICPKCGFYQFIDEADISDLLNDE